MDENIFDKIEQYMKENGEEIDNRVQEIVDEFIELKRKKTEEDFKMAFIPLLQKIACDIGIKLDPLYENTVYKGRMDAFYNCVDLEYKKPGSIEPLNSYPSKTSKNIEYIEEVKKQIKGYSKDEKIKEDCILGIIFDGSYFIYVNYLTTDWCIEEPEVRNRYSIEKFLKNLFSLQINNKAVTIKNLVSDFGFSSKIAKTSINTFYDVINEKISTNNQIQIIFEQWKSLFREVSGYSYDTEKLDLKELKNMYGFGEKKIRIDYLIFSIHTYYALLIKVLVIKILYHHKKKKAFQQGLKYDTQSIAYETMKAIENGGRFKELGILNFLEEDFFGWYLKVWDKEIFNICTSMLQKFDEYNYNTVNLEERNSKDLLKKLYNYLLPKTLRHALGEYYSPDWLAQHTYNMMQINGQSSKKILDPTCGSGTFIVIAIKEIIKNNPEMSKRDLLNTIIQNVHGFDLNPLAVISARANYIIALGDLIDETDEDIEIPIFHSDAMLTILEQKKENHIVRKLATRAGVFEIPLELVESKNTFYATLEKMDAWIEKGKLFNKKLWDDIKLVVNDIDDKENNELYGLTENLYNQIKILDEKGIRKIWIQIIKNAFAPIFHEKVDYIIGNPPWINWQTLPEDYRDSIHKHWYEYKIFDIKGLNARLGGAHDDISVLLTYVVMDNLLKKNGRLGFIINQNLLQASNGGEGFRKFKIKEDIPIKVEMVEDFVDVQPFQSLGASNKTAIIMMKRDEETCYPVKYKKWTKKYSGVVDSDDSLDSVMCKIQGCDMLAEPIKTNKNMNAPWIINTKSELKILKKLIGKSDYIGRKGIDTSANGIFWVEILEEARGRYLIRSTPENSKKKIPSVQMLIEKDIVYPLVRGKDISKWKYRTPYSIIVPYEKNLKKVLSSEELEKLYPKAYNYFYNSDENPFSYTFIELLKNRAIYKKHYTSDTPVHVLYNIGKYTSAPYKVLWKTLQGKGMNACVISAKDSRMVLPDHNNILVPFESKNEAYYLCGVLNSKIIGEFVDSYISWFKSAHILNNIGIPNYNEADKIHREIATKAIEAHLEVEDKDKLEIIENQLDSLVIKMLLETKDEEFQVSEKDIDSLIYAQI